MVVVKRCCRTTCIFSTDRVFGSKYMDIAGIPQLLLVPAELLQAVRQRQVNSICLNVTLIKCIVSDRLNAFT